MVDPAWRRAAVGRLPSGWPLRTSGRMPATLPHGAARTTTTCWPRSKHAAGWTLRLLPATFGACAAHWLD